MMFLGDNQLQKTLKTYQEIKEDMVTQKLNYCIYCLYTSFTAAIVIFHMLGKFFEVTQRQGIRCVV